MDDYNFSIENDTLLRNEISNTEEKNVFQVRKTPIITKEVFKELYRIWIEEDENAAE